MVNWHGSNVVNLRTLIYMYHLLNPKPEREMSENKTFVRNCFWLPNN